MASEAGRRRARSWAGLKAGDVAVTRCRPERSTISVSVHRRDSTIPRAPINGVHLHYESYGNGFPLVLAYGLGGNTGLWAGQLEAFSRHYQVILWDPRGHGQSDSPPQREYYSLQISAEDLRGLLDHRGITHASIGGQSMGGGIAARFAVTYPDRVAALLSIDSASASGLPMSAATRENTIELAETQGMAAVAEREAHWRHREGRPHDICLPPARHQGPARHLGRGTGARDGGARS
jgi:pimeloyl-ACP methyl ester carboxylesterase